jgi:flagellar assembly factor FliW
MPKFETIRFGTIEVPEEEVLEFRRGLLGFESLTRFVHIVSQEDAPFGWLQSLDDARIAFVVTNPAVFFPDYRVEVDPRELGEVRPGPNDRLVVVSICTLPEQFADATLNLQGPLVWNASTRRGKQLVLNRSPYHTQHRLIEPTGNPSRPQPPKLMRGAMRSSHARQPHAT